MNVPLGEPWGGEGGGAGRTTVVAGLEHQAGFLEEPGGKVEIQRGHPAQLGRGEGSGSHSVGRVATTHCICPKGESPSLEGKLHDGKGFCHHMRPLNSGLAHNNHSLFDERIRHGANTSVQVSLTGTQMRRLRAGVWGQKRSKLGTLMLGPRPLTSGAQESCGSTFPRVSAVCSRAQAWRYRTNSIFPLEKYVEPSIST